MMKKKNLSKMKRGRGSKSGKKKVSVPLHFELLHQVSKAVKGHRTLEAYLLLWSVYEQFDLPKLTGHVAGTLKIELPSNFIELPVSQTIRLYYFLSHDKELYNAFERARKSRNKILHRMYENDNWATIKALVKKSLKEEMRPLAQLISDRYAAVEKIPVFEMYRRGWQEALEEVKVRLLKEK